MSEENRVCDDCVGDAFLAKIIGSSDQIRNCDYCGKDLAD